MLLDMMSLSDLGPNDARPEKDNALVLHHDVLEAGILEAGTSSGVQEGNVYTLAPLGTDQLTNETIIGTATVTHCGRLRSRADLNMLPRKSFPSTKGVRAFLKEKALRKLPVSCPTVFVGLRDAIDESKYIFRKHVKRGNGLLAEFQEYGDDLVLVNGQGVQLASRYISDKDSSSLAVISKDLVKLAEQLARAKHLLSLTYAQSSDEKLEHNLSIIFGTVKNGQHDRVVTQDGNGYVIEGEPVYISLTNNGSENIHVSVFNVNVAGKISLLSRGHARGIEMPPQRSYVLGDDQYGLGLKGLPTAWPSGVHKTQAVTESLVLILSDSPADLGQLTINATRTNYRRYAGFSSLERLAFSIATGEKLYTPSDRTWDRVCYDALQIPFRLTPFKSGNSFLGRDT
ncbi:hypothetical protein LY76DRAFT_288152 [Colletotrichum caudatum]|nr:hypothetical protein LY76DRAFT_288152 [Colletotrichum caudatum]